MAALSWLPAATAIGATPVRKRFVRLAERPYATVATMHAPTASAVCNASAPSFTPALFQASPNTPTKPIARPSTRVAPSVSLSHSQAISAPNSGVAALKMLLSPALMLSAA